MKRLALLAITGFLAVVLSACGESAEKKAENGATSAVQSQENTGAAPAQPGTENSGAAAGAPNDAAKTGQ
ncbi:hypothetical protein BN59_02849 [Legionella massiliensis]|uniref:Uncharacterized protein n=1 Tax=Legionella massiliensis TaxID=1034943 RepID=A0A078L353_9GAMM|nr:hypothetical protein [Legionella massiliensis]CDZ78539.1 hypothetical protein BN59_02849 [Legionella massiliensis]CEE14277.1 hypothetical protein BN1094_02849 [Legionella massiliensis]